MIWQLIYVTTNLLRWGAGTGGALSAAQIDKNFGDLEERVDAVETHPPAAVSISTITQAGNTMTVRLTNAAEFTIDLPLPIWDYVGDWAPDTPLFRGDIVNYQRTGLYLLLQDIVTDATFDASLANTSGPVYRFLFNPFAVSAVAEIPETTDLQYMPVLADANNYLRWRGADDLTVIIAANADVPHTLDTELHFRAAGAGKMIFEGADGVTINPPRPTYLTETSHQGENVRLKQVAIDEWDYIGEGVAP